MHGVEKHPECGRSSVCAKIERGVMLASTIGATIVKHPRRYGRSVA